MISSLIVALNQYEQSKFTSAQVRNQHCTLSRESIAKLSKLSLMFETCVISHQLLIRLRTARVLLLSVTDGQSDITSITESDCFTLDRHHDADRTKQNKVNHCQ